MEECKLVSYKDIEDKGLHHRWENSKQRPIASVSAFSMERNQEEFINKCSSPVICGPTFKVDPAPQKSFHMDNSSMNNLLIRFDKVELDEEECVVTEDFNANRQGLLDPDSVPLHSDEWYSFQPLANCGCPFSKLHHSGLPTEFLHCPLPRTNNDMRSKQILAGMNDLSTGVSIKVQFIVNNLNDCLGIWPQLFLQKLNAILVHGDRATIITILTKDDFAILKQIVSYYSKETKCSMVFRYFCFLYNAFSRNMIQVLPSIIKNQLLIQLQIDFSLASQDSCRCKLNHSCVCQCEPDEEHRNVGSLEQLKITAILMYYLVCKIGNHAVNTNDIYEATCTHLNIEVSKFIDESVVPLYIKLYEKSKDSETPAESNLMELLSHLLIGYNCMPYQKTNGFVSAVHRMLDMGYLSSAVRMKDIFLNVFQRETDIIYKVPGSRLMFNVPELKLNFTTLGLPGAIKALQSLISEIEYGILTRDELASLMDTVVSIQMHLSQNGLWNVDYENIYLHCHQILGVLQKKLGNPITISEIKLDSDDDDMDSTNEKLNSLPAPILIDSSTSVSSSTSQSRLHPQPEKVKGKGMEVEGSEDDDGWVSDTRRISKIRKGYVNERHGGVPGRAQIIFHWISNGFNRLAENCAKLCQCNGRLGK
ncbi:hypothetical protein Ocin01_14255 [Orchesella cincta]|uniref:Uncharacterized protein n=1 Tax=Orchesella cincta TaxID=48709 RepID=A0A1D2MHF9_ORCCI|nr:hypothetical protein Ocin01_14255 [Orchesella cincta]